MNPRPALPIHTLPVSPEVVCVWVVTPPDYHNVEVVPEGATAHLLMSRRLIAAGRRINLFLYETREFRDGWPCVVSYLPESGAKRSEHGPARLADWGSAGTPGVVRQLLSLFPELAAHHVDPVLLRRFLSLASSWRTEGLFAGRLGDLNVAALAIAAGDVGEHPAIIAFSRGAPRLQQVELAPLEGGSCLVWRGEPCQAAFLDVGGELVELALGTTSSVAPGATLADWLRELGGTERDGVLQRVATVATAEDADLLAPLADVLARSIRIVRRDGAVVVHGVVTDAEGAWLIGEWEGGDLDDAPGASIAAIAGQPNELMLYRRLPVESGGSHPREVLVYRSPAIGGSEPCARFLTFSVDGCSDSAWIASVAMSDAHARRLIRTLIPWHRADGELIRDLYAPIATPRRSEGRSRPIALSVRAAPVSDSDPLFICFGDDDLDGLRLTLAGISLTTRRHAPTLRVIARTGDAGATEQTVQSLAGQHALHCEVVLVGRADPIDSAFSLLGGDREHGAIVLVSCGAFPREPDWWTRVLTILRREPGAVIAPPGLAEALCAGMPVDGLATQPIVLGPSVDDAVVHSAARLMTFDGLATSIVAGAERLGVLRSSAALDFHAPAAVQDRSVAAIKSGWTRLDAVVLDQRLKAVPSAESKPTGVARPRELPRRDLRRLKVGA